jgi:hypothetical protein
MTPLQTAVDAPELRVHTRLAREQSSRIRLAVHDRIVERPSMRLVSRLHEQLFLALVQRA